VELPRRKNLQTSKWRKLIFSASLVLCVGSLALVVFLSYRYQHDKAQREQKAFANAKREAFLAAIQINRELAELGALTKTIANDLTDGRLAYELVTDRLKAETAAHPELLGLGVAFEPHVYGPEVRLYAPYYLKDEPGVFQLIQVEDDYDYTQPPSDDPDEPSTEWYHRSLSRGSGWIEPFFGTASDALLTLYGAPFYRIDSESLQQVPAGVAMATVSLKEIDQLMASLDLGATGYSYVLSKEGLFIAHPIKDYVGNLTIFELAESLQDEGIRSDGERAIRREIFSREAVDNITGQSSWIFYEPIPITGWSIGIVLNKDEFAPDTGMTIRQLLWIALALMAFLTSLSLLLFRADKGGPRRLWSVAISFSLLCILMMVFTWYLASSLEPDHGIKIVDRAGLDRFLIPYTREANTTHHISPFRIPTGLFIQTIRVPAPNNVAISGYVWQKYADDLDKEISRGFILPQLAGGVPKPTFEEAFRRHENGQEIIGWYFAVTLRQPFDPSKYPFDHENVSLRLWHQDFDRNVILTPDLDAYEFINPILLPGIDDELVLKGWHLYKSAFVYRTHSYNTDFGLENSVGHQQNVPELCFEIGLRRNFVDPFIAYMIPLGIVAFMMFAVLSISPKGEAKDIFSSLSYGAAMFFVVAVAHNGLRAKIAAQGVTYLEYFYILMYAAILTISVNTVLRTTRLKIPLIRYKDGLIPQLLYWPILLGLLLTVTLLTFYPR
jgi:hypothetical protein